MEKWLHIIADLYKCDFNFYINKNTTEKIMFDIKNIIQENFLTVVWEKYFEFEKNSFTLAFLLAESHLTIHTWPEENYISIDIFVCNYSKNNEDNARNIYNKLLDFFKSWEDKTQIIYR